MEVVAHDRVGCQIKSEDAQQELEPVAEPLLTMRVVATGECIEAAEKRSPNTTIEGVKDLNLKRIDGLSTCF